METLAGIAIVLLGLPVYYSMKRRPGSNPG